MPGVTPDQAILSLQAEEHTALTEMQLRHAANVRHITEAHEARLVQARQSEYSMEQALAHAKAKALAEMQEECNRTVTKQQAQHERAISHRLKREARSQFIHTRSFRVGGRAQGASTRPVCDACDARPIR